MEKFDWSVARSLILLEPSVQFLWLYSEQFRIKPRPNRCMLVTNTQGMLRNCHGLQVILARLHGVGNSAEENL